MFSRIRLSCNMAESRPNIYHRIKKISSQIQKLIQSKRYSENRYFNIAKKNTKKKLKI
jgi:hypothetical protein